MRRPPRHISEQNMTMAVERRDVPGEVDAGAHTLLLGVRVHAARDRQVELRVGGEGPEVGSVVLHRMGA
jgi:hypothetical protein